MFSGRGFWKVFRDSAVFFFVFNERWLFLGRGEKMAKIPTTHRGSPTVGDPPWVTHGG